MKQCFRKKRKRKEKVEEDTAAVALLFFVGWRKPEVVRCSHAFLFARLGGREGRGAFVPPATHASLASPRDLCSAAEACLFRKKKEVTEIRKIRMSL